MKSLIRIPKRMSWLQDVQILFNAVTRKAILREANMMNWSKHEGSELQVNCALGTFLKIYPTTFEISLFPITFANEYSNQRKKN